MGQGCSWAQKTKKIRGIKESMQQKSPEKPRPQKKMREKKHMLRLGYKERRKGGTMLSCKQKK